MCALADDVLLRHRWASRGDQQGEIGPLTLGSLC
jgi:hypothetical protein